MGSYVVKFGPDKYVEWSSVSDSPISGYMTRDQMAEYLFDCYANRDPDYHDIDRRKIEERLVRTDQFNTSQHYAYDKPRTPDDIVLMWILNQGPRNDECTICNSDEGNGPCPLPGHMWTTQMCLDVIQAMTEQAEAAGAAHEERTRPQRERLVRLLTNPPDTEHYDQMVGYMYSAGVMDTRDIDHLEYRDWSWRDLMEGKWEVQYEEEVMRLFRKWNERLGTKVFMEEGITGALTDSISKDLGVPFEFASE